MKEHRLNRWLSISAYSRAYGLSRPTIRKLLDQGCLESYRVLGMTRIRNVEPDAHHPHLPKAH
jgi:hypothetical protein